MDVGEESGAANSDMSQPASSRTAGYCARGRKEPQVGGEGRGQRPCASGERRERWGDAARARG